MPLRFSFLSRLMLPVFRSFKVKLLLFFRLKSADFSFRANCRIPKFAEISDSDFFFYQGISDFIRKISQKRKK